MAWQTNLTIEQSRQRNSMFFDAAIGNLITISLIKAQAHAMNIAVQDAEVDARLQQLAQIFPTPEDFRRSLAEQEMTEADLRNNLKESLLMQKVLDEASKDAVTVTDAMMEKFYADNPDRFDLQERAHAAHILLKIPPDATAAQKEEIRKRLERVRVEIAAEVITFAEAAAKYSQDENTASKGGDLGLMTRDAMSNHFANALFNTKPGTVSPALESQSGYHILKALELKPAERATLEEAKPALRQFLEQNARQSVLQKFVTELRNKATIEHFMTAEEFDRRRR